MTRTFRVFVSSTFEDLVEERNALQREVFPALRRLCEAHSARFQAIDLRWGVRDEAVLGQRMMETCLAEIDRCQRTGIKPNFIVLLGDRYGRPPLPARIPQDEFESVIRTADSEADRSLIEGWYQRDDNAVPPEYLLRPRTGELVDANRWREVEDSLGPALRKTARTVGLESAALLKYVGSASHQEIVKGLGTAAEDRRHTFAFLRRTDSAKEPPELAELKAFLGKQLGENALKYDADEISNLCRGITAKLSKVILDEVSRFESPSALELEIEAHDAFAKERSRHFTGRAWVLSAIADYLKRTDPRPLIVYGPSGSGKSAIIAKASEDHWGVRRFIGVTPTSSNGVTLLRSLCEEIGRRYGQAGDLPATFNELVVQFQDRLRLATSDRPLVLYIDALDQMRAEDPAATMDWMPRELPPNCRVVLSTIDIPARLTNAGLVTVEPFSVGDASNALDFWLADAKRTLRRDQRDIVLDSFRQTGLPLYLKLAFEEGRRWKSFDPPETCVLGDDLPGIIDRLFARLSKPENHGLVFVKHALGLLSAARYGLTEYELLDILAANDEVWEDFDAARRHELPDIVRRLPTIVWSRLHLDLEPYLTERTVSGGTVITFYHSQFRLATGRHFFVGSYLLTSADGENTSDAYLDQHRQIARYFRSIAYDEVQPGRWRTDQVRSLSELPFHQTRGEMWQDLCDTLTDFDFLEAKCTYVSVGTNGSAEASQKTYLGVYDLLDDYRQATERGTVFSLSNADDKSAFEKVQWLGQAIRVFSRIVVENPRQLIPQVLARLPSGMVGPALWRDRLVAAIVQSRCPALVPGTNILSSVKSPLIRTFSVERFARTLDFSPDGRLLAVLSSPWGLSRTALQIWDIDTGRPISTIATAHRGLGRSVRILRDGSSVATIAASGEMKLWEVGSGREVHDFPEGRAGESPILSQDAQYMVHWSGIIWDLERDCEHARLTNERLLWFAISHNGRIVFWQAGDARLHIFDVISRKERLCLHNFYGQTSVDKVAYVAASPDGRYVVAPGHVDRESWQQGPDGVLHVDPCFRSPKLWDLASGGSPVCELANIKAADFTPDGSYLLTITDDRRLEVRNSVSGNLIRSVSEVYPGTLLISKNGRYVAVGDYIWDIETGSRVALNAIGHPLVFSPDSRYVAVAMDSGIVRVGKRLITCDLTSSASQVIEAHAGDLHAIAISPDARVVATASDDATVKLWDANASVRRIPRAEKVASGNGGQFFIVRGRHIVQHFENGKELALLNETPPSHFVVAGEKPIAVTADHAPSDLRHIAKLWNVSSGNAILSLRGHPSHAEVSALAISDDGAVALTGDAEGMVFLWNTNDGSLVLASGAALGSPVTALVIVPGGKHAIIGSKSGALTAMSLGTGNKVCKVYEAHRHKICALAITGDGRRLLSAAGDTTLYLWRAELDRFHAIAREGEFSGHNEPVHGLAITADSAHAISASLDCTLRVWEISSRLCVERFDADDPLMDLAFSRRDGKLIAIDTAGRALAFMLHAGKNSSVE